jgi:hypothetical protein
VAADLLPLLPDRPFKAVILPVEIAKSNRFLTDRFSNFWTPTTEQVAVAEKRISQFLATAPTNKDLRPSQRKLSIRVRDEPSHFFRQYLGAVRNGRRIIYCVGNSITLANIPEPDWWRRRFVLWADTAASWQIDYDLEEDTCGRFKHDEGY